MVAMKPTVYIVDDDDAAREGVQELADSVGLGTRTFASAQGFLDSYDEKWEGCLLLDVRMPGMSGLKLQEELNGRGCRLPIVFLTGHGDVSMAVQTLRNGAVDFVEKPAGGQYLLDKIYEAIQEGSRLKQIEARKSSIVARLSLLTPREREVLGHVKQGERPKVIAIELGLSRKTVDWHLSVIREKMGVESTGELLLLLHEGGQL